MVVLLSEVSRSASRTSSLGAGATFLRVELVLLLAALWSIPVGVFIGLRPKLAAIAQPVAQIAASVPATALFPIVLLGLIRLGGGPGDRLHRAVAARNAVVPSLQRHRGRQRDSDRPYVGLRHVPPQQRRPLVKTAPAADLPLFDHRLRDRFRRSVECE